MHEWKNQSRLAYKLTCGDDWLIYISTAATTGVDNALATANADWDCSAGNAWGVTDDVGDGAVNVRL